MVAETYHERPKDHTHENGESSIFGQHVFDNSRVLESYCQDDVTDLRKSCHIFRREFLTIVNIEVSSSL